MTKATPPRGGDWRAIALALALGATLAGCASGPNPRDPYEKFNRQMFKFNDAVDQAALKPAATAYKRVLPSFVQTGVSNFFGNLSDAWSGVNNLLQGKGQEGMSDIMRFAVNTSFGLGGLLDIGSEAGMPKHNEDFGQTLGAWGIAPGPYLMLPLLGPSTVRDTVVIPLDIAADPWGYKEPVAWRNVGIALRAVDQRATVLDASNLMEEAALDRYEFIRDGFLQRRQSRITDNGEQKIKHIKLPFRKGGKQDDAPADANGIKAANPDDPGASAPAATTGTSSDAKRIEAAYADDPGPTALKPADQKPADPKPAAPVSSEPPSK